jgi:site-specific DNA recombinase
MGKKRIGIWIRVSTKMQSESDSPEHHLERAKMYAYAKDWDIIEEYHLEAVSGKTVSGHPEAMRMMRDIKSGHISGLIFSKIARLARNVKELLEFADLFKEYNADLISLNESIDTTTPSGRFFYTMISAMSQWERENIVERINSSVEVRAKMGKVMGPPPFGYDRDGKSAIKLNQHEAMVRKMMYELFLEHKRFKTVAGLINEMGYRTKKGSKFTGLAIKRLLIDPISKGIRRSYHTVTYNKQKVKYRSEDKWYLHKAPRIVSDELWDQVNQIIINNENKRSKPLNRLTHIFTGFLYCGCGGKLYMPSSNAKYTCKNCKLKIKTEDIEMIFREQLTGFIVSEEEVKRFFDNTQGDLKQKEYEIEKHNNHINDLNVKITKLIELHENGQIETDRFHEFYNPPNEEIKSIKLQISRLEGEILAIKDMYSSSGYIIEEARSLYQNWESLERNEKRRIVEAIVDRIIVSESEVDIRLNYILPKFRPMKRAANGVHDQFLKSIKPFMITKCNHRISSKQLELCGFTKLSF